MNLMMRYNNRSRCQMVYPLMHVLDVLNGFFFNLWMIYGKYTKKIHDRRI